MGTSSPQFGPACQHVAYNQPLVEQIASGAPLNLGTAGFTDIATVNEDPVVPAAIGDTVSFDIEYLSNQGVNVPCTISVTRLTNGGSVLRGPQGNLAAFDNGDFLITHTLKVDPYSLTLPVLPWIMYGQSVGNNEVLEFVADNPVIGYTRGNNGAPATLTFPYVGTWQNNNSNNASSFEFAPSNSLSYIMRSANNLSMSTVVGIMSAPRVVTTDACSLKELFELRADNTPSPTFATAEISAIGSGQLNGNGNGSGTFLTTSGLELESGWAASGVTGLRADQEFDYVEITAHAFIDQTTQTAEQRISPALDIIMTPPTGAPVVLQISSTGYQRHTGGHDESSNAITRRVNSTEFGQGIPLNTLFQVRARRGNPAETGAAPVTQGTLDIKGVNRISVRTN